MKKLQKAKDHAAKLVDDAKKAGDKALPKLKEAFSDAKKKATDAVNAAKTAAEASKTLQDAGVVRLYEFDLDIYKPDAKAANVMSYLGLASLSIISVGCFGFVVRKVSVNSRTPTIQEAESTPFCDAEMQEAAEE